MTDQEMSYTQAGDGREDAEFVEVMYAKSPSEAQHCLDFLAAQNVPARLEQITRVPRKLGVAVLVPSDQLVNASEALAARDNDDDEDEEVEDEDADDHFDDDFDDDDDDEDDEYDDEDDDFDDDLDDDDDDEIEDDDDF